MVSLTLGCYSTRPVVGTGIPAGTQVELQLTDAGRLAMAETLGSSADVVQGRLVSRDSAAWTVAVSSIQLLRGGQQVWSGEHLRIRPEHVALASERRFSRGRTAIVSAAVVGVIVGIVKSGLVGMGQEDGGPAPSDSVATVRIPRP
ncbi:hypothetical protein [Gemmatimonas aurantiaca]|uniref:hypothetical protein n=1 Tax=Gemmatimonas aurantiaca TaxID=173480 RepID=UPI00301D64B0